MKVLNKSYLFHQRIYHKTKQQKQNLSLLYLTHIFLTNLTVIFKLIGAHPENHYLLVKG